MNLVSAKIDDISEEVVTSNSESEESEEKEDTFDFNWRMPYEQKFAEFQVELKTRKFEADNSKVKKDKVKIEGV
jgi:hypothetical protein